MGPELCSLLFFVLFFSFVPTTLPDNRGLWRSAYVRGCRLCMPPPGRGAGSFSVLPSRLSPIGPGVSLPGPHPAKHKAGLVVPESVLPGGLQVPFLPVCCGFATLTQASQASQRNLKKPGIRPGQHTCPCSLSGTSSLRAGRPDGPRLRNASPTMWSPVACGPSLSSSSSEVTGLTHLTGPTPGYRRSGSSWRPQGRPVPAFAISGGPVPWLLAVSL